MLRRRHVRQRYLPGEDPPQPRRQRENGRWDQGRATCSDRWRVALGDGNRAGCRCQPEGTEPCLSFPAVRWALAGNNGGKCGEGGKRCGRCCGNRGPWRPPALPSLGNGSAALRAPSWHLPPCSAPFLSLGDGQSAGTERAGDTGTLRLLGLPSPGQKSWEGFFFLVFFCHIPTQGNKHF